MWLTRQQIVDMYNGMQEYRADYVWIEDVENGSGIGTNTNAQYYRGGILNKDKVGEHDITDMDLW